MAADEFNYDGWYAMGVTAQAAGDGTATGYFQKAEQLSPWTLSIQMQASEALQGSHYERRSRLTQSG